MYARAKRQLERVHDRIGRSFLPLGFSMGTEEQKQANWRDGSASVTVPHTPYCNPRGEVLKVLHAIE